MTCNNNEFKLKFAIKLLGKMLGTQNLAVHAYNFGTESIIL